MSYHLLWFLVGGLVSFRYILLSIICLSIALLALLFLCLFQIVLCIIEVQLGKLCYSFVLLLVQCVLLRKRRREATRDPLRSSYHRHGGRRGISNVNASLERLCIAPLPEILPGNFGWWGLSITMFCCGGKTSLTGTSSRQHEPWLCFGFNLLDSSWPWSSGRQHGASCLLF